MSITETAASVAARAFFYPSLAWNIARNRLQETWHWWDEITPNVVLGAIPFYSTLDELKELGIQAVVTLNETFEVFITTEQYQDSGFQHLHIPTVDFLYAPPTEDLHRGADFIHEIAAAGGKTYVHCKAGRGRSTTLVLCYLIKYCGQTAEEAYAFVREKRPQVCLAQGQWTAVCSFYVSCHPEKGLKAEDFPHPSLLPIAPGKQGTDGVESSMVDMKISANDSVEPDSRAAKEAPVVCREAQEDVHRNRMLPQQIPTSSEGHTAAEIPGDGGSDEGPQRQQPAEILGEDARASANSRSDAGLEGGDREETVVLNSAGSTVGSTSDSDVSLVSIATALSACCIHPRVQEKATAKETEHLQDEGPPRSKSPAIEIPRTPEAKLSANASSSESKASISLEPSGSLPGYVRIAPNQTKRSQEEPTIQATFSSMGFGFIDDWADLGQSKSK